MYDAHTEGDLPPAHAGGGEHKPPPPTPEIRLSVAYRFSNLHGLHKRQAELDFVDILVDTDIPLFLDPFAFRIGADAWSRECNDLVIDFFQELIDSLRNDNAQRAKELLANLHEPNETRLGVSQPKVAELPQGRGVGEKQAIRLYAAFAKSKAAETGILTDLNDCELFIEGISHDKISDITINIVRRKLIEFTQQQCRLWKIPMERVPAGPCWDADAQEWRGGYELLPVYKGSRLLLVPKRAVRYRLALDYGEYYDKHIVEHIRQEYEQQECLNSNVALGKVLRGRRRVTKKSVKEKHPSSKAFARQFSEEHPDVLGCYRREAEQKAASGKFRPSDTGIYEQERNVAHGRSMYLLEEVAQMRQVRGDVIIVNGPVTNSVIGSHSREGLEPPAGREKAVLQFVGGDRGGSPRDQLQLPREEKKIREAITLGNCRDSFAFAPSLFDASIDELIACRKHEPAIVHFAGHGRDRELLLVRDRDPLVELMRLNPEQVKAVFRHFPRRVRLVLFNACHSLGLASHLVANAVVELAIGVEEGIPDDHAIRFAATFYRQLAEGQSVQAAFELGGVQVGDLSPAHRPHLRCAVGTDPQTVVFANLRAAPQENHEGKSK